VLIIIKHQLVARGQFLVGEAPKTLGLPPLMTAANEVVVLEPLRPLFNVLWMLVR
jgi:hypothetical protein